MTRFLLSLCIVSVINARRMHVYQRRKQRVAKATLVLTQLAQDGCDLNHFQQICVKAKRVNVDQDEVLALTKDTTILENAKYVIGLYARSGTTRRLVDYAGSAGSSEFLREQQIALESK